ncbi:MAG TPA: ChaN family lipoprotein [bacterium]|nr:ChaN family lipoprotein [bacterium]
MPRSDATAKPLSPRQELLKIQKKIFAKNDEIIRSQAMVRERGFDLYERRYKRHVRAYEAPSGPDELIEAIRESDVIYLGDYHTNPQSQRTLLRILKQIAGEPNLGVGLELVQKRHQKHLDDYLSGRISEETFLERINLRKFWYFDLWENFKPIFDFAKFHKVPLFGIEYSLGGDATLTKRDRESAAIIASILKKKPGMRLIVFIGDLHTAPEHLPAEVGRILDAKGIHKKDLIIYQNSESIYWRLAENGIEDKVEIVRVSDHEFCVINTPPIVWQQTFLNWLEHEEGEIDYADARHSFLDLLQRIAEFLGLEVPDKAEEVEVFTCGDLSFLKTLKDDGGFTKTEIKRIKQQILASESYCIPQKNYVYLGNLSLNHAAEEASHYLKYLSSGPEFPRDPVDAFYANIIHEAVGFFGSKIINHKRKCFHEKEYAGLVTYLTSSKTSRERHRELEIALLVLRHREMDRKGLPIRSRQFFRSQHDLFFGVTHGLGYMLGDRLYYAMLDNRVSKGEIRELYHDAMKEDGSPFELYRKWTRRLRGVKIPRRV